MPENNEDFRTIHKRSNEAAGLNKTGCKKSFKLRIKNQAYTVNKRIFIGRTPDNDIVIKDDPLVSRKHACIEIIDEIIYLKDLDSTNATYINNNPVKKNSQNIITNGDVIKIGNTELNIFETEC